MDASEDGGREREKEVRVGGERGQGCESSLAAGCDGGLMGDGLQEAR